MGIIVDVNKPWSTLAPQEQMHIYSLLSPQDKFMLHSAIATGSSDRIEYTYNLIVTKNIADFALENSSFNACKSIKTFKPNIFTSFFSNDSNQMKESTFDELKKYEDVKKVEAFEEIVKKSIQGRIKYKKLQAELLSECANFLSTGDSTWFDARAIDANKAECLTKMNDLKQSIHERFFKMRQHLIMSQAKLREDRFINNTVTWIHVANQHEIRDFQELPPISADEIDQIKELFANEIANMILTKPHWKNIRISLLGLNHVTIGTILNRYQKNFPLDNEQQLLTRFLLDKAPYALSGFKYDIENLHQKHRMQYTYLLSQLPILGYFTNSSPDYQKISLALTTIAKHLESFLSDLQNNTLDSRAQEYTSFLPDIEQILSKHPNYCGLAETLLNQSAQNNFNRKTIRIGLGLLAGLPCFTGGPLGTPGCILLRIAPLTALTIYENTIEHEQQLAQNLVNFDNGWGYADFYQLSESDKQRMVQLLMIPLAAFKISAQSFGMLPTAQKMFQSLIQYNKKLLAPN